MGGFIIELRNYSLGNILEWFCARFLLSFLALIDTTNAVCYNENEMVIRDYYLIRVSTIRDPFEIFDFGNG